jgi:hypothetical protein
MRFNRHSQVTGALVGALILVSCGGSDNSGSSTVGSGGANTGGSSQTGGSAGASMGGSSLSGGSAGSSNGIGGAGGNAMGAGGNATGAGGGSSSDASAGAAGLGMGQGDASTNSDGAVGPGGNTTTFPCGSQSCSIATQICCVAQNGRGAVCVSGSDCAAADAGQPGDLAGLKCTGAANCAQGTVCCIDPSGNSACAASCDQNGAQLCDPAAANPGCGDAGACSSRNIGDWGLPRTFGTCGGIGM